jgi:hypothetical protein
MQFQPRPSENPAGRPFPRDGYAPHSWRSARFQMGSAALVSIDINNGGAAGPPRAFDFRP